MTRLSPGYGWPHGGLILSAAVNLNDSVKNYGYRFLTTVGDAANRETADGASTEDSDPPPDRRHSGCGASACLAFSPALFHRRLSDFSDNIAGQQRLSYQDRSRHGRFSLSNSNRRRGR